MKSNKSLLCWVAGDPWNPSRTSRGPRSTLWKPLVDRTKQALITDSLDCFWRDFLTLLIEICWCLSRRISLCLEWLMCLLYSAHGRNGVPLLHVVGLSLVSCRYIIYPKRQLFRNWETMFLIYTYVCLFFIHFLTCLRVMTRWTSENRCMLLSLVWDVGLYVNHIGLAGCQWQGGCCI